MKRALSLLVLATSVASAQTYDYAKKIGIGAGYGFEIPTFRTGTDSGDKAGQTFNVHARYGLSSAASLILTWDRTDLAKSSANADTYTIMYLRRVNALSRFTPTYGAGLGFLNYANVSSRNEAWHPTAKVRGGAEYSITQNLVASFDVDVKWTHDALQDRGDGEGQLLAVVPQANLTWFFGCGKSCEKKATPAPVAAAVVAPKDTDGDGVIDAKDKCPGTTEGAKVNAYGCVAEEKAHIKVEVHFDTSKSNVTAASHPALEELAAFLAEHPQTKAEIQGHSDSSGNPAKNKVLSQQRADAVKAHLVNVLKVDGSRLSSKGYGADQPVATNATAAGRTENRRVMAVVEE